jgi:glucose/arabinose dehydrogenase
MRFVRARLALLLDVEVRGVWKVRAVVGARNARGVAWSPLCSELWCHDPPFQW